MENATDLIVKDIYADTSILESLMVSWKNIEFNWILENGMFRQKHEMWQVQFSVHKQMGLSKRIDVQLRSQFPFKMHSFQQRKLHLVL